MPDMPRVSYYDLAAWLLRRAQQSRGDLIGKLARAISASPLPAARALTRAASGRGSKQAAAVEAAAQAFHRKRQRHFGPSGVSVPHRPKV